MKKLNTLVLLLLLFVLTVSVQAQQENLRNMVIEYTTSTQCGGCPCLDSVLQEVVLVHHPNIVVLACHTEWSHFGGYHGQLIADSLNAGGGDPSACIDRTLYNIEGYHAFVDSINNRAQHEVYAPVGLTVTSKEYNSSTRILTMGVNAESLEDTLSGLYRINFVVVEGNIMFEQAFHPPCSGGPNYIHYHVVRNMVNDMYGDTLINGTWAKNQSIHRTFTTVLEPEWVDHNCDYIFYVYKQAPGPLRKVIDYHIQQGIRGRITGGVGTEERVTTSAELMSIYPNPVTTTAFVHITIPEDQYTNLRIMDPHGRVVKDLVSRVLGKGEFNYQVSTEGMAKGIYHCVLTTGNKQEIKKLVIL